MAELLENMVRDAGGDTALVDEDGTRTWADLDRAVDRWIGRCAAPASPSATGWRSCSATGTRPSRRYSPACTPGWWRCR